MSFSIFKWNIYFTKFENVNQTISSQAYAPITIAETEITTESIESETIILDYQKQILKALKKVMSIVPTAGKVIFPVLVEHFPHKITPVNVQTGYLKNLLHIIQYVSSIQDRIIGLIVEKLVAIDVEIQLGVQEDVDGFAIDEMADKLDQMMLQMFQFIQNKCNDNQTQATAIFYQVLRVFDRLVLHKVLGWVCS